MKANAAPGNSIDTVKWIIIALLSVSTFLNYVDRQTLALLSRPIQAALNMDDKGYAFIVTVFMFAYMGGNIVSGWVIDRLGARLAMPLFVAWWSIASGLSGLVHDPHQMAMTRFALGLAEVGNFIAAPALVNAFFPPRQRALGIGIYTATAMFGAAVSPPLITWINEVSGWRLSFVIMGAIGIVWSFAWMWYMGRIGGTGKAVEVSAPIVEGDIDIPTWWRAVTTPQVWGIVLGFMLTWPVWYFYLNWFPKYLTDERGLSTLEMGRVAWIVYAAAGLGCLIGGSLSGWLTKRGMTSKAAKLWVMGVTCVLAPVGLFNAFAPPIAVSLGLAAAVAFFHMYWQTNMTALPTDLFTARSISKVFAFAGICSGLGGIGTTWLIGQLVATVSYKPMFVIMAFAYPIAIGLVLWLTAVRPVKAAATTGD